MFSSSSVSLCAGVNLIYGPLYLGLVPGGDFSIASDTFLFIAAIASDGTLLLKGLVKYHSVAMVSSTSRSTLSHFQHNMVAHNIIYGHQCSCECFKNWQKKLW